MRQITVARKVLVPELRKKEEGGYIRYNVGSILEHKTYPREELPTVDWAIVNQLQQVALKFWFRLGAPRSVSTYFLEREDLRFSAYKRDGLQTNCVYSLVQALKNKKVRLLHFETYYPKPNGDIRVRRSESYYTYSIARAIDGTPPENMPRTLPGRRPYIPLRERAQVCELGGSIQSVQT
jgi:hypothetical protein